MRLLVCFVVVLAMAACTAELPTSSIEGGLADQTASVAKNAPAQSGSKVFRSEGSYWYWTYDETLDMEFYFGLDVMALCSGGEGWPVLSQAQEVIVSEYKTVKTVQGNDLPAQAFYGPLFSCADALAQTPDIGTVHLRTNDNDLEGRDDDRNANTWGARAQGTLTTPSGETKNVNWHFRCVWNDQKDVDCKSMVNYH